MSELPGSHGEEGDLDVWATVSLGQSGFDAAALGPQGRGREAANPSRRWPKLEGRGPSAKDGTSESLGRLGDGIRTVRLWSDSDGARAGSAGESGAAQSSPEGHTAVTVTVARRARARPGPRRRRFNDSE